MRVWIAAALAALVVVVPAAPAAAKVSLLPFPSNAYTVKDRSTPTGLRVHLTRAQMPRNKDGVPIDPRPYNRADGFSPGAPIPVRVPPITSPAALRRIHAPTVNDVA